MSMNTVWYLWWGQLDQYKVDDSYVNNEDYDNEDDNTFDNNYENYYDNAEGTNDNDDDDDDEDDKGAMTSGIVILKVTNT